jgi:hypothetical protein
MGHADAGVARSCLHLAESRFELVDPLAIHLRIVILGWSNLTIHSEHEEYGAFSLFALFDPTESALDISKQIHNSS